MAEVKLARVVRADAVMDGDTLLDGSPVKISSMVDHEDAADQRDYDTHRGEMARAVQPNRPAEEEPGSAPQEVVLAVGRKKFTLSPSDLIVVLR